MIVKAKKKTSTKDENKKSRVRVWLAVIIDAIKNSLALKIYLFVVLFVILGGAILPFVLGYSTEFVGRLADAIGVVTIIPAIAAWYKATELEKRIRNYRPNYGTCDNDNAYPLAISAGRDKDISSDVLKKLEIDETELSKNEGFAEGYFKIIYYVDEKNNNTVKLTHIFCESPMPENDTTEMTSFLDSYYSALTCIQANLSNKTGDIQLFIGGPAVVLGPPVGNIFRNKRNVLLYHFTASKTYEYIGVLPPRIDIEN